MPPSSQAKKQPVRRPVLRFELDHVSLDDRPNAYKRPQLVLKPQLELPARETYTGSQPLRIPIWHHFLMVHVKDKADELVKIDLNDFKDSPILSTDRISQRSVFCLLSEASIVFRYSNDSRNIPTTLKIGFKKPSDFEAVLSELRKLDIRITYEHLTSRTNSSSNYISSGFPPESERNQLGISRQMYNTTPSLTASTSSQDQYSSYSGFNPDGDGSERPSSQLAKLLDQHAWSPAVAPSQSNATIGNTAVLGQPGLYKISRVGSTSSGRLRVRPPSIPPERQILHSYAPTNPLHGTLERRDPFLPRRPSKETAGHLGAADFEQSDGLLRTQNQAASLPPKRFSRIPNLGGVFEGTRRPKMQRLDPIYDDSDASPSYTPLNKESMKYASFQPASAPDCMTVIRNDFGELHHDQSQPGKPTRQEPDTMQLMQISQIHHQGFLEANKVWNHFMERAGREVEAIDDPEEALKILLKLEPEFTKQWDRAVAFTVEEMQRAQCKGATSGS
ncbi:hypothetical protein QBC44DRAFT_3185 [Cladorrhinum sp. PSN332]|nr:hypothetical protein QBC44DRAFT_3185 [Cladorrhinum sp. PSN332]